MWETLVTVIHTANFALDTEVGLRNCELVTLLQLILLEIISAIPTSQEREITKSSPQRMHYEL